MTDKIKISKKEFEDNYEVEKPKEETKEVEKKILTIDEQIAEADADLEQEFFEE